MRRTALLVCIFYSLAASAQSVDVVKIEGRLDSLQGVEKAIAFYDLVATYVRVDPKKAKEHLESARVFANSSADEMVRCYTDLSTGVYQSMTGGLDSAMMQFDRAYDLAKKNNDVPAQIKISTALGKNSIASGKAEKGITHLFEALRLLDAQPDTELMLKTRVNVMWGYLELKRYRDCIAFGRTSLSFITPQYEWIAIYLYNNIAVSYGEINNLDSARYFAEKSIRAAAEVKDYQTLANAYFILGNVYASSGQYDNAIAEYLKARPYREKVGNPMFIVSDLYTIAELYQKTGNYRKGVEAGLEGLRVATEYDLLLKFEGVYQSLAMNYEGLGDYRNASKYYKLWAVAKDSVYKNSTANAIAEVETKYETEKKQQRIELQNVQLAEQQAQIRNTYLIIGGLVVITVLVIIILILVRNRLIRKQKLLKAENEVVVREAYIEATIQSQEAERKRFAQDLHDSMGQLISSLRMIISSIERDPTFEGKVQLLTKSELILDEMHKEIRSVAFNLMPQTLIQEGLLPALSEMARRVSQSGTMQMRVKGFGLPGRLGELQEISLYRVVQEWTTNAIKYSCASKISVQLVGHEGEISLTIEDDGNGFAVSTLENGSGNGWKNIQSRLNLVKATLFIDSVPGRKGTTLVVTVPVVAAVGKE
jgi:signal transduction histidine kinase/tetratricopeptide (TPR) repeat protein